MDAEDYIWAGEKLLNFSKRVRKSIDSAKAAGRHPGLIENLTGKYNRLRRVGNELIDMGEEYDSDPRA